MDNQSEDSDQNQSYEGPELNQIDREGQEQFFDSRVVKTVRNLKRISSATPEKQLERQMQQQQQANAQQQRVFQGSQLNTFQQIDPSTYVIDQGRVPRLQQQRQQQYQQQNPSLSNSSNNLMGFNNGLSSLQESNKEETLQERIRRIRIKNNPNLDPNDENKMSKNQFIQLQMQQMNSALGTQSSKVLVQQQTGNLQSRQMNNNIGKQSYVMKDGSSNPNDVSWISDKGNNSFTVQQQYQKMNNLNGKSSKTTTADSQNNGQYNNDQQEYLLQQQQNYSMPMRGVNPDSNVNLQNDVILLEQKKDKCIEIFKSSTLIHDILQKAKSDLSPHQPVLDLNSLIQIMFQDRHFTNLLTNFLQNKPAANKLEKFLAEKVQERIITLQTDQQIQNKFETLNLRIQQRLERLQQCFKK